MQCDNCGNTVEVNKSLRRGKSAYPDECPKCESPLEKSTSPTRLEK